MSCFVCKEEVFRSVAKVCYLYGKSHFNDFPKDLAGVNKLIRDLAELNCRNVAIRYHEVQYQMELSDVKELSIEPITVQDIKYTDCWKYQTCDYLDKEPLYKSVAEALIWAKSITSYTNKEYSQAYWG